MKSRMESDMSFPVVIGIDIGKEVFHLVGFAADGKIAFRRRIRRLGLKDTFESTHPDFPSPPFRDDDPTPFLARDFQFNICPYATL